MTDAAWYGVSGWSEAPVHVERSWQPNWRARQGGKGASPRLALRLVEVSEGFQAAAGTAASHEFWTARHSNEEDEDDHG